MYRKPLNDEEINKIIELYNEGYIRTEIANIMNISEQTVTRKLKENNIEVTRRRFDNKKFENINTEEQAYWLGFLYADGCIKNNRDELELNIGIIDIEHLEKFKKFMNSSNKITIRDTKPNKMCKISFTNKKLKDDLVKLGCVSNKTFTLQCPTKEQVPQELFKHFARGFTDGDGCLTYDTSLNQPRLNYTCASFEFLENIRSRMNWNTNTSINKRKDKEVFQLTFGSKDSIKYMEQLYSNCNIFLERKFDKYNKLKQIYYKEHN